MLRQKLLLMSAASHQAAAEAASRDLGRPAQHCCAQKRPASLSEPAACHAGHLPAEQREPLPFQAASQQAAVEATSRDLGLLRQHSHSISSIQQRPGPVALAEPAACYAGHPLAEQPELLPFQAALQQAAVEAASRDLGQPAGATASQHTHNSRLTPTAASLLVCEPAAFSAGHPLAERPKPWPFQAALQQTSAKAAAGTHNGLASAAAQELGCSGLSEPLVCRAPAGGATRALALPGSFAAGSCRSGQQKPRGAAGAAHQVVCGDKLSAETAQLRGLPSPRLQK